MPPDNKKRQKSSQEKKDRPVQQRSDSGRERFHIIAVGASAGGLEALESLFESMPLDTGAAFVVVQHLSPEHESYTPELLARRTDIPIVEAEEGMSLEADTIYIKKPKNMLSISGGAFRFVEEGEVNNRHLPIDLFFRALADDLGERAIGVILSGAGSDGSQGLRAIHRAGGVIFVQDPDQASHTGMPRSAIDTDLVDYVLPVDKMPGELGRYMKHPAVCRASKNRGREEQEWNREITAILRDLRSKTGHDFTEYKKSTIHRRIQRRMAIQHIESMPEYADYVKNHSSEAEALFRDLLINVTSFFRDPEAFAELKTTLADYVEKLEPDQEVRVWCPGCATGEEAYSLAILLREIYEEKEVEFPTRIFGTDLNARAIEYAREAIYPENIGADLSENQLEKNFQKKGDSYKVDPHLREMIIFAVHNLTSAPPFSRLDLVCCRNLLIYLDASMQKKIQPLLHYSLKPEGLLFLGKSEDIGDFTNLFAPVNKSAKIFRARKVESGGIPSDFNMPTSDRSRKKMEEAKVRQDQQARERTSSKGQAPKVKKNEVEAASDNILNSYRKPTNMRSLIERTYMERYAPPGVLVDGEDVIRYFHGDTGRYLSPPNGEPSFELKRMVLGDFQHQIFEILHEARQENKGVVRRNVSAGMFEESPVVDLVASPVFSKEHPHELILLTFEEKERNQKTQKVDARIAGLERELQSTRQDLQATIEELESSNEELQSANEELQANNEELQSANEELETSREELQSINEELEVLNAELEQKNDDLAEAKDDVTNLFNATGEGTIILDAEKKIKRFTPAMTRYFKLIDTDVGRPVTDISSNLRYEELDQDIRQVLERLATQSREIQTRDNNWVQVKIQPYRTSDNVIAGVVMTCADMTQVKKSELLAQRSQRFAEAILATMREPLLVLNGELRIASANRAFFQTFDLPEKEVVGHRIYEIDDGSFDLPGLRQLLEEAIPKRNEIFDYDFHGELSLWLNARRMVIEEENEEKILISFTRKNDKRQ